MLQKPRFLQESRGFLQHSRALLNRFAISSIFASRWNNGGCGDRLFALATRGESVLQNSIAAANRAEITPPTNILHRIAKEPNAARGRATASKYCWKWRVYCQEIFQLFVLGSGVFSEKESAEEWDTEDAEDTEKAILERGMLYSEGVMYFSPGLRSYPG